MNKLNLGCGEDIKRGYVNVDFRPLPGVDKVVDLSKTPWPFEDCSADEILMLDFLEHFPYRKTDIVLTEAWRVLKEGGSLVVQVPDFEHCARALEFRSPFLCNRCGWKYPKMDYRANFTKCEGCGQQWIDCALAAAHRLYGGQDYEGNWHHNTFSKLLLREILYRNGFGNYMELEEEHQYANWNFKVSVTKKGDVW